VKVCEGVIKNRQIPGSRKHKQTPPHFLNFKALAKALQRPCKTP